MLWTRLSQSGLSRKHNGLIRNHVSGLGVQETAAQGSKYQQSSHLQLVDKEMRERTKAAFWGGASAQTVGGATGRGCGQEGVDQSGDGQGCRLLVHNDDNSSVLDPFAVDTHPQFDNLFWP